MLTEDANFPLDSVMPTKEISAMPNRMTPAQRAKTVYRGEKPDRIPFTVYESKVVGKPYELEVRANDVCLL